MAAPKIIAETNYGVYIDIYCVMNGLLVTQIFFYIKFPFSAISIQ